MKNFCFVFFGLFSTTIIAAQNIPSADEVLRSAYQKAANQNKNIFLLFRASWCGWCRDMDSTMKDPSVKAYFEKNYVITHLTVYEGENKKNLENPGAFEFLKIRDGIEKGIPFWMILDRKGKTLADSQVKPGENTGRPGTPEEVAHFVAVLEKTSAMTIEEKIAVQNKFTLKN